MLKLIDFWADWCPPCKRMTPIIKEIEKEFKGEFEIVKIDVDQEQGKAEKYEIFSIPTYVLEKGGKEIARISGARSKKELEEWIKKHL